MLKRCFLFSLMALTLAGPAVARDLQQVVDEFREAFKDTRFQEALPLAQEALKLTLEAYGQGSLEEADAQLRLGMLYHFLDEHTLVVKPLQRAAEIYGNKLPADDVRPAMAGYYLGFSLYKLKRFQEARPWLERTLPGREERLGEEGLLTHLMALSVSLWSDQDHPAAVPVLERVVLLKEKQQAEDLPRWQGYLGKSLRQTGNYRRAAVIYRDAVTPVREPLLRAELLSGYGEALNEIGDFALAEKVLKEALAIREEQLGPDDSRTNETVGYLARVYFQLNDSQLATRYYSRFLNTLAAGGQQVALLQQTGELLSAVARRDPEAGLAQLDAMLAALGKSEPDHTLVSVLEGMRGVFLVYCGRLEEAKPQLEAGLAKITKNLGPGHPMVVPVYQSLALVRLATGDVAGAEQLLSQGLALQQSALGDQHPVTSTTMLWLAVALKQQGKDQQAREMALRQRDAYEAILANVLSFTSERQRLSFQGHPSLYPYLLASLGFGEECAQAVLRSKGLILDSLVEDVRLARASKDPRLTQLKRLKAEVVKAAVSGQKTEQLERQVESLESELARTFTDLGRTRRALSVTVPQVQSAIPAGGVLLEFFQFFGSEPGDWPPQQRYGVVVLAPTGEAGFVDLGPCRPIDLQISRLQRAVRQRTPVAQLLIQLDEAVWQPLRARLPQGTSLLVVSPDADLNLLPFACLLDQDGRFLCERYQIRMVASGRDLLAAVSQPDKSLLLLANPDYQAAVGPGQEGHQAVRGLTFNPLPGSQREADTLAVLAADNGWQTQVLTGAEASEETLKGKSPGILHLATHGFFLGAREDRLVSRELQYTSVYNYDLGAGDLDNPMYRSGLALSGAASTAEAWEGGRRPPADADGILTAQEAGNLNLDKTLLVTLSACDTGLGQSRVGEGLLGLRRALVQAGATHTLVTLWPIDDAYTVRFMANFYGRVLSSGLPAQALASSQREALVELRQSQGVDAAVHLAGGFQLSSQGRP